MGIERNNYQVGIYLEKALNEKNMTIKQLSESTGISNRLLSKYLINEQCPSLTTIKKIAKALDREFEYFIKDFYFKNSDMRNSLLNYDLLSNINENSDSDNRNNFKSMVKILNQVFNSLTDVGRKKLEQELFIFLSTEVYTTAYDEKNPNKTFWSSFLSDDSLLKNNFTLNEKDIVKFRVVFEDLLSSNVDHEEKEKFINSILDKVNIINQLHEQKTDNK